MSDAPDNHELARRLAILEERMNTHQAAYEAALERNNAASERLRADLANRDTKLLALFIAIVAAIVGIATAFLSLQ